MKELSLIFLAPQNLKSKLLENKIIGEQSEQDFQHFSVDNFIVEPELINGRIIRWHSLFIPLHGELSLKRVIQKCRERLPAPVVFVLFEPGLKHDKEWKLAQEMVCLLANSEDIPLIVIRLTDNECPSFLEEAAFSSIPRKNKAGLLSSKSAELIELTLDYFKDIYISTLGDIVDHLEGPEVGLGVLAVSKYGKFLLLKRKRPDGNGTLGTFGGAWPIRKTAEHALKELALNQLSFKGEELSIGPLLSCSNMIINRRHRVDLTFLAVCNDEPNLKVVDLQKHEIFQEKTWFTFDEMLSFYKNYIKKADNRNGVLFEPVANAFERFCITCIFNGMTYGLRSSSILSKLNMPDQMEFKYHDEILKENGWTPRFFDLIKVFENKEICVREHSPYFFEYSSH